MLFPSEARFSRRNCRRCGIKRKRTANAAQLFRELRAARSVNGSRCCFIINADIRSGIPISKLPENVTFLGGARVRHESISLETLAAS